MRQAEVGAEGAGSPRPGGDGWENRRRSLVDAKDMPNQSKPSISAVVAAYQAERFIGETLESILTQTRPPEEVIVVDDGSTDGTARELERFSGAIRVLRRPNGGCPAAFNTAFQAARGDFVAMCGADDIWEPQKLEWQLEAIQAYPDADVLFGHAVVFGQIEAEHLRPTGSGLLESSALRNALFIDNCVCAPSVVIRRSLFERLGPFVEDFGADDYEYWFRCLRAGARFYYDPRTVMRWRRHENNLSMRKPWMDTCSCEVRRWYAADVADRAIVCAGLAPVLHRVARRLVDEGRPGEASRTYREALGYARGAAPSDSVKALAWIAVLGLPARMRERVKDILVGCRRALDGLRQSRVPTPS